MLPRSGSQASVPPHVFPIKIAMFGSLPLRKENYWLDQLTSQFLWLKSVFPTKKTSRGEHIHYSFVKSLFLSGKTQVGCGRISPTFSGDASQQKRSQLNCLGLVTWRALRRAECWSRSWSLLRLRVIMDINWDWWALMYIFMDINEHARMSTD